MEEKRLSGSHKPLDASPPSDSSLLHKSDGKGGARRKEKRKSRTMEDNVMDISNRRRMCLSLIQAIEEICEQDHLKQWKKKECTLPVLHTICRPLLELLMNSVPQSLDIEQSLLISLQQLYNSLSPEQYEKEAAQSPSIDADESRGLTKKIFFWKKLPSQVAVSHVKRDAFELQTSVAELTLPMHLSEKYLLQIFPNPEIRDAWSSLFAGELPSVMAQYSRIWGMLLCKHLPQNELHRTQYWKETIRELFKSFSSSTDQLGKRVTCFAFADFFVYFNSVIGWYNSYMEMIGRRPEFLWLDGLPVPSNAFENQIQSPVAGMYLFRFSQNKTRRLVLQLVRRDRLGGVEAPLVYESLPIDVMNVDGERSFDFFGKTYYSLEEIVRSLSDRLTRPIDRSPYCKWFWSEPMVKEKIAEVMMRTPTGSYAIVRQRMARVATLLYVKTPTELMDFLIYSELGTYRIKYEREYSGHTLLELIDHLHPVLNLVYPVGSPLSPPARLQHQFTKYLPALNFSGDAEQSPKYVTVL